VRAIVVSIPTNKVHQKEIIWLSQGYSYKLKIVSQTTVNGTLLIFITLWLVLRDRVGSVEIALFLSTLMIRQCFGYMIPKGSIYSRESLIAEF